MTFTPVTTKREYIACVDVEADDLSFIKLSDLFQSRVDEYNTRRNKDRFITINDLVIDFDSDYESSSVNCNLYIEINKTQKELDDEIKLHNLQVNNSKTREFKEFLRLKEKYENNKNGL